MKLIVATSSRALFNLDDSHQVFEKEGIKAYSHYQIEHENDVLSPGTAFSLIKKLLGIVCPKTGESLVEVVLVSRNSADTGLRVFNSIADHNLAITRAAFTSGRDPYRYLPAFGAHPVFIGTYR